MAEGQENFIGSTVTSTRVRLARNLEGYPFPDKLSPAQAREIVRSCGKALSRLDDFKEYYIGSIPAGIRGNSVAIKKFSKNPFSTLESPVRSFSTLPVKKLSQSHPARSRDGQSIKRSNVFWRYVSMAASKIACSFGLPESKLLFTAGAPILRI